MTRERGGMKDRMLIGLYADLNRLRLIRDESIEYSAFHCVIFLAFENRLPNLDVVSTRF